MAKLPSAEDLGATPSVSGSRPVASYDVSGASRAAASVAEAGRTMAAGGQALGKGIGVIGEGLADVGAEKARYEFATAHAEALSNITDLKTRMGNDPDYPTLAGRYEKAATEIYNNAAQRITLPALRNRFLDVSAKPDLARVKASADTQAFKLEGDANGAYVSEQGDKFINQAVQNPHDTQLHNKLVDGYGALVDGLHGRGFVSAEAALRSKQDWAHRFAFATGIEEAKTNPLGVINNLRSAPQSLDQVDNRIAQIESNGDPLARSKTSRAFGLGQFVPETWLPLVKKYHPELADRSDDELLALRADRRLSMEMIGKNREENSTVLKAAGVEPSAGNVYLAHFLGPAAAAAVLKAQPNMPVEDALKAAVGPEKAAQMIAANGDILRGQTSGTVAQWAHDKMGGVGPGGGHLYDLLRPDQRAALLMHAEQAVQKREVNDYTAFNSRVTDTVQEAMSSGVVQKPMSLEEFVAAHGAVEGPKAYATYKAQLQLGADKAQVASMSHDEQQALLQKYDPQPGEGFADADKRQKVLASEIERVRKIRVNDPEFLTQVSDSLAEAGRTGKAAKPVERGEFISRFGSRDGPKAYADYSARLRLGRDVNHVGELSPDEQRAMLGGYDPELQKLMTGTDYDTALKRRDSVAKAIGQVRKELLGDSTHEGDPAGYAVRYLPVVGEAYSKLGAVLSDPQASAEDRSAAAKDYAAKTDMEQARLGVPADQRRVVPQQYVDTLNDKISKAADSEDPKARVGLIGQVRAEAEMWGKDAWPQVMRQMGDKIQPTVRAIAAGADPTAMTRLLSLGKDEKPAALLKEQNETKAKDLTTALNTEMAPYLQTLVGRQRDRDYTPYYNMAQQLAALYVRDGDDAQKAASKAFNALVGGRYDFKDTFRIPKSAGVDASQVQAGAQAARYSLDQLGVKPAIDDVGLRENNTADSMQKFARDGVWVTSPDQDGLNLVYGDKFVKTNDGERLFMSWADLAKRGKDAPAFDPYIGTTP